MVLNCQTGWTAVTPFEERRSYGGVTDNGTKFNATLKVTGTKASKNIVSFECKVGDFSVSWDSKPKWISDSAAKRFAVRKVNELLKGFGG